MYYKSKRVPEEYRIQHYAGVKSIGINDKFGNADKAYFYAWESFGGDICVAICPHENQIGLIPIVRLYVSGELIATRTITNPAISGKNLYATTFGGLNNGDTYELKLSFAGDEDEKSYSLTTRTYTGSKGDAPDLAQTSSRITASMSSPFNQNYSMALGILGFDSDYGTLRSSYSREARTRAFESCLQYTEYNNVLGKVGNWMSFWLDQYNEATDTWTQPTRFTHEAVITRFPDDTTIKVGIASPRSTAYYSVFSGYVNEWISDINTLLGRTLVYRNDTISEDDDNAIMITIGSHKDLWGYDPDESENEVDVKYGHWDCTYWYPSSGAISHIDVKLCNEFRGAMANSSAFRDITYEELTEALGCGNDTFGTYNSLFSEIWYVGKENNLLNGNSPTYDGEVVQMLYNNLSIGEVASDVIHKLTPSRSAVIQLPNDIKGVAGHSYIVRPYAMNRRVTWDSDGYFYWNSSSNGFSDYGTIITVTVAGSTRPSNWAWTTNIVQGGNLPYSSDIGYYVVTAAEWNDFTDRINEFRRYKGLSDYSFTRAVRGNDFTAAIYNQAVNAIKGISGYGTYLSTVSKGDNILANHFILLKNELNAIP